jgi:hypothetical protein
MGKKGFIRYFLNKTNFLVELILKILALFLRESGRCLSRAGPKLLSYIISVFSIIQLKVNGRSIRAIKKICSKNMEIHAIWQHIFL